MRFILSLIDPDRRELAAMGDLQNNVLANQAPQQMRQVRNGLGDIEHPRDHRLLAGKCEQLTHQIRCPVGVLLDLHDVGEGLIPGPVTGEQEIASRCLVNRCSD